MHEVGTSLRDEVAWLPPTQISMFRCAATITSVKDNTMTIQISIPEIVLGAQGLHNTALGLYGLLQRLEWLARVEEMFGGSEIPNSVGYILRYLTLCICSEVIGAEKPFSIQLLSLGLFTTLAASEPSLHRQALIARAFMYFLSACLLLQESSVDLKNTAWMDIGFGVVNAVTMMFVMA